MAYARRWIVIVALLFATSARAKERLVRHIGIDDKLLPENVQTLAQDPDGFIWIGTAGGLTRFDGTRLVPWAPETIRGTVSRIATRPGELVASIHDGLVFRVTAEAVSRVDGPDGKPLRGANDLWFDRAGRLWIATSEAVLRWDGTRWSTPLAGSGAARAIRIRAAVRKGDSTLFALTGRALWSIDGEDRVTHVADFADVDPLNDRALDILPMPDGSVMVSRWFGSVHRYRDGVLVHTIPGEGVARMMAARGDVVWVAHDQSVAAIYPDGRREVLPSVESIANRAICILVDREGSLWVGNGRGVFQFPEPSTATWNMHDGLPSEGPLRLARTPEGLWITHWGYRLGRISPDRRGESINEISFHSICADGAGVLWGVRNGLGVKTSVVFSKRLGGPFVEHADLGGDKRGSCSKGRDGRVWIAGEHGLWRTDGDRLVHVGVNPTSDVPAVIEGASTLWLVASKKLCEAPVATLNAGSPAWQCHAIDVPVVTGVLELPSGALWITSARIGIVRWTRRTGIQPIAAAVKLPSTTLHVVAPARDGGIWLGGAGFLIRVEERGDDWTVIEQTGPDNGVPAFNAMGLLEDDDGTLWATTNAGVLELPASSRNRPTPVITPRLIDVAFDGRNQRGDVELRAGENTVALEITALSYRDPSAVEFRVRVDGKWSAPSRQSTISLVDLPAGDYRVEIAASADQRTWATAAESLQFAVVRPWYQRPWAWVLFAMLGAAIAYSIYRVRLGFARRLERQRQNIAMDLHDDLGSKLGGIGLMAGLTADDATDDKTRRAAAAKLAQTAKTLGESLSSIVTSLRDDGGELPAIAAELVERASMLFPDERPQLVIDLPQSWPEARLDRRVERNLKLIVSEALHNAAKHARATQVVLGARATREELSFFVEDDGPGIPREIRRKGLGLTSMKRRAERIGAEFAIASPAPANDRGTRVVVVISIAKAKAAS